MTIASDRLQQAMHLLYYDKATISGYQPVIRNGATEMQLVAVAEDIPCKVSKKILKPTELGNYSIEEYHGVLYCAPDVNIPDAATITITDANGRTGTYTGGKPFGYPSHQETLLLNRGKAK